MNPHPKSLVRNVLTPALLAAAATAAACLVWFTAADRGGRQAPPAGAGVVRRVALQVAAEDPFEGGVAWLNTGEPIRMRDLKGKIVLLDFWTFCCINCHHVLPDLARLEEKYKNELVVIGVHTPKFTAERDTANLRKKVREYGIKHPVVNDADQVIWNRFGVQSWPTLGLLDPEGKVALAVAGEGHFEKLDHKIGELVEKFRGKGLNETPLKFFPENEKPDNTPLLFPGKVLADAEGDRLFVSDTGHNRVVVTDLKGHNPLVIGNGTPGLADGSYEKAEFSRPQGMSLIGETLYVADTENHAIRAIDLKAKTVSTAAGTGKQSRVVAKTHHAASPARETALSSPWDLAHVADSRVLYVAMAGTHQLWRFDTEAGKIGPWAGSGLENIVDAPLGSAAFAQPSGLATDGVHLFVADSEGSAVRSIPLGHADAHVSTIVGTHDLPHGQSLFAFDDVEGKGRAARLQHCLGVAYGDGKLFIADTYNNKVKVFDPKAETVAALAGSGKAGETDDPAAFSEPGGLSLAGSTLYVADTNNHKVRTIDLQSDRVSTLELSDLSPPGPRPRKPFFPNAAKLKAPEATIRPGDSLTLAVKLPIPEGYKLNAEGSMPVLVETPGKTGLIDDSKLPETGTKVDPPARAFTVNVPLARAAAVGDAFELKVSVASFVCSEGSSLCTIKSYVWTVPVTVAEDGSSEVALGGR